MSTKPSVPVCELEEIAATICEWGWDSSDAGHAMAQGAAKLIREAIANTQKQRRYKARKKAQRVQP